MRTLARLGAVVIVAAMAVGCTVGGESADDSPPLRVGASLEPPTLDPVVNDSAAIPQLELYNIYETLVRIDPQGQVQPLLAARWETSADRRTWTFELDERATFASGRKVAAKDVVWSLNRVRTKGTSTQKAQLAAIKDAAASSESTVKLTLSTPSNALLYNLGDRPGMVFDSELQTDWHSATAGSGPYRVKSWNQGSDIVLESVANHWSGTPGFSEVVFRYFSDADAMNNALLAGDLDIISNVQAPSALDQFSDPSKFTVIDGTTNGEVVLGMNHQSKILQNPDVRRAIHLAIDRRALVDSVWDGHGQLIGTMAVPTDPWYEDLAQQFPHDPAAARALLKKSGVKNPTLRLRLPTTAYATGAGKVVESQLKAAGFTVKSDHMDFARWYDQVFTRSQYDLTIVAHVEPRDIVKFADAQYYWHYDNKDFATLVNRADTGPENEYATTMREAARLLSNDTAAVWLFVLPNLVVTTPDITGVPRNLTTLSFDLTSVKRG